MTDRWVCKRCFSDNDGTAGACARCGLTRGSESSLEDQQTWAAQAGVPAPATAEPSWRRWLRFWWIPALLIVLAVGYFTTARRGDDGSLSRAGTVAVDELREGDCFNAGEETEISDVDGVPCTEPHAYEVFAVANHEAEVWPESTPQVEAAFDAACWDAFGEYVGEPYDTSELYASMITPSRDGWDDGDREFICYLYDPEDDTLTESMQGAAR